MDNKISIIIPTRDCREHLEKCLASIIEQTYKNYEIIVVDQRSSDGTVEVAEKYGVHLVSVERPQFYSPPARSRNIGATHATGSILYHLDSDMILPEDLLWHINEDMQDPVVGALVVHEKDIALNIWARAKALERECYWGEMRIESARVVRKDVFDRVKGYDEKISSGEDFYVHRKYSKVAIIKFCSQYVYHNLGTINYFKNLQKKFNYGKTASVYLKKAMSSDSECLGGPQIIRVQLLCYVRNYPTVLKKPVLGAFSLFQKFSEYLSGFLGSLYYSRKTLESSPSQVEKVFFIDSYSMNTGDIGILISMLHLFAQKFPESSVIVESSHPDALRGYDLPRSPKVYERIFDVSLLAPRTVGGLSYVITIFRNIFVSLMFFFWAFLYYLGVDVRILIPRSHKDLAKDMVEANYVVSVGGGFLSTKYNYFLRLYAHLIFLLLKKDVYLLGQSIGPFETLLSRNIVPFFLNKYKALVLREPNSLEYLAQFGLRVPSILSVDFAFLLPVGDCDIPVINSSDSVVSITLKDGRTPQERTSYFKAITAAISNLLDKSYKIVLVAQTIADDALGSRILSHFCDNTEDLSLVPFGRDPRDIKHLYQKSEFVISGRMHGVIFSADTLTPFISLSYEPKFKGLMTQLEYPSLLNIDYSELDEKRLMEALEYMVLNKDALVAKLKDKMPVFRESASKNFRIIHENVEDIPYGEGVGFIENRDI